MIEEFIIVGFFGVIAASLIHFILNQDWWWQTLHDYASERMTRKKED